MTPKNFSFVLFKKSEGEGTPCASPPSTKSIEMERRLEELKLLRIMTDTELDEAQPSLSVDGVPVLELEDLHAIKAKQKAGKTTALKVIAGALMAGKLFRLKSELEKPVVLWLDTEQKSADVKKILSDIQQMTGVDDTYLNEHMCIYQLRKLGSKTILDDTKLLISNHHPQVVIIDGVVEYVESFNDEQQSHKLINDLLLLSEQSRCAILCVLHENKTAGDHNMRGHLGTMLAQKAATVLQCSKNKGVITVSCSDPRHQEMPMWRIRFDEEGHIVPAEKVDTSEKRLDTMLEVIQEAGGSIPRNDLTSQLMDRLGVERSTVSKLITSAVENSYVNQDGDSRNSMLITIP